MPPSAHAEAPSKYECEPPNGTVLFFVIARSDKRRGYLAAGCVSDALPEMREMGLRRCFAVLLRGASSKTPRNDGAECGGVRDNDGEMMVTGMEVRRNWRTQCFRLLPAALVAEDGDENWRAN
jgi:hypothetical protein